MNKRLQVLAATPNAEGVRLSLEDLHDRGWEPNLIPHDTVTVPPASATCDLVLTDEATFAGMPPGLASAPIAFLPEAGVPTRAAASHLEHALLQGFALQRIRRAPSGEPRDYVYLHADAGFLRVLQSPDLKLDGRSVREVFPEVEDAWIALCAEVSNRRSSVRLTRPCAHAGTSLQITLIGLPDDLFACIIEAAGAAPGEALPADVARVAVEYTADTVIVTGRDGIIRYVNPAFEAVTGLTRAEVVGKTPRVFKSGLHSAEFYRALWDTLLAGRVWRGTFLNRRSNGEVYPQEETITPVRGPDGEIEMFVSTGRDVSARRRAEEEQARHEERLRQAQRLEAAGMLAGGIAHSLNNALTAVLGHAELLKAGPAVPAGVLAGLEEIVSSARRAESHVRRLLAFSRQQAWKPEILDLSGVVQGMETFLLGLAGKDVRVLLDLPASLPSVRADRQQIEESLIDLVVNARHALPRGGTLAIRTEEAQVTAGGRAPGDPIPGHYVTLAVTDTGVGMTPEVAARCFEPFFTTRPVGEGTGLGLAAVHGIAARHGGTVTVASAPGRGSTFRIYVPVYAPSQA